MSTHELETLYVSDLTKTASIDIEESDGINKQLENLTSDQRACVLSVFYCPYI